MARRRVPVVGANTLHPVQISPQIRHLEAKRAREAARRAAAPVLAADRGAFGTANQQYRTEAASARGATSAVESALAQALGGLKGAGLSGTALQQTRKEFTSRAGDAASALPALLAGAGEERGKALTDARTQLMSDRASMQSDAASSFNQRLKELRGQGSTAVASQQEEAESGGRSKSEIESLSNASIAFKNALSNWSKNPTVEVNGEEVPAQEALPLKSGADWRVFAEEMVHHSEGFGLTDAMTVIRHYLTQRKAARKLHPVVQAVTPFG